MFQSPLRLKDGLGLDRREIIDEPERDLDNISRSISAMRRQAKLCLAFSLAGLAAGIIYVATATSLYTATTTIIVDNRQVRAIHDVSTLSDAPPTVDSAELIDSQMEILRSEKIALAVIRSLNLTAADQAFTKPGPTEKILEWVKAKFDGIFGDGLPPNEADQKLSLQLKLLKKLSANLAVDRAGHSFVLEVAYTSPSPTRAAEIANAFAAAYLVEQLNVGAEATRHAQSWLQQRTEELRRLSSEADFAAQKFRADHNLIETKGALVSEQQLNEMTSQLVTQRSVTEEAKARYLRIKNVIDTNQTDSAVTESLANPVISELRTKYLEASKRMLDLQRKLGPNHITVVDLKNTMEEFRAQLFQELARIAETYRSDYEVAATREKALAENLARQQTVAVTANDAQVELRQLEQKADSDQTLYKTFMQRYQETAQQEGFPLTDAHVISEASRPLLPSYPRTAVALAISLAVGTIMGFSAAIFRERSDRVFRTMEDVRAELGADALGLLPIIPDEALPNSVPGDAVPIMRFAIDNPLSAFAETLRAAKVAADHALRERCPKIIGLVSLLPKEGKSTVAKNFASLLALQGASTLLIDADIRNPALTRAMGYGRGQGSKSATSALPSLAELLRYEPEGGLQVLPCLYARNDPRVAEGLTSATFRALMQSSDRSFDYIVVDLPPIGPVVNARGMASAIDAFILVVEWGATARGAVRAVLARDHMISEKLLGVILNKVDMKKLKIYEHFGSDGYYNPHYESYYNKGGKV
jgi:succinoglycan biosynthesis transport protein ExoP